MFDLSDFYRTKEWRSFREIVINERTRDDGFVYDEVTGKPILQGYNIILHHKIELTPENVNDHTISLNPDNIMIVTHKTHNHIHNKLGYAMRQVYLVYGSPMSGKTSWVKENASEGDLIVDMDSIWQCISGCERYVKPPRLKSIAFKIRDSLIESVKYRQGKWNAAWIIGGYALSGERERLIKDLGAREIFIDTPKEECLARLKTDEHRNTDEYVGYIERWFDQYGA